MYKGIIFDLDGVICFTDQYHYQAWKKLADERDIPFDEDLYLSELNKRRATSRAKEDKGITLNTEGSY